MKEARHISEERLRKIAIDDEAQPSKNEDSHFENCESCIRRFVELIKEIKGKRKPHGAA
jgi:hypothetical protein